MFVLVAMTDTVRIPPWNFERILDDAVVEELNKKLANKVVYNIGLCICLFDLIKMEDSYVFPGDGASHTKVHFKYVVFRPFLDEIVVGKIRSCGPEGVQVSLGFFDDIIIPPESLQQPSKFDETEQVWAWEYETDDGTHDLFMDIGEDIRFRVIDETFVDTTPTGPSNAGEPATPSGSGTVTVSGTESAVQEELQKKQAPYTLTVCTLRGCFNFENLFEKVEILAFYGRKFFILSAGEASPRYMMYLLQCIAEKHIRTNAAFLAGSQSSISGSLLFLLFHYYHQQITHPYGWVHFATSMMFRCAIICKLRTH
uniref:DNA-directed RNA polymerase subunit n=1 Tax=Eptatretus burgeri TaxID=7764 RepID=A0A8C4Q1E8_EPTBU